MSPYLSKNYRYQPRSRLKSASEAGLFIGFSILAVMLVLFILGWIAFAASAASGINSQLNYQGKLNDSSGVAVANGTYNIKLAIYDASSGGNCLWTAVGSCADSNIATTTVTTVNGVFSVALGGTSQNSLATSTINWNTDSLYLGVTIRGTVATPVYDDEMTPRKRITSSAYAFNADLIDGLHATSTAAVANYLLALDSFGNLNLFGQGVSSTYATTTWLYVRGSAQIDGSATTSGNLNVSGYASTTNLVLADGASNLGTYYDLYVNSGNLFFNGSQLTGSSGLSFWQYAPGLEKTITPTSTASGIFVTASSTIAANFRVDGSATTTKSFYVGSQLNVATSSPWAGYELAVTGDGVFSSNLYAGGNLLAGGYASSTNLYTSGILHVGGTSVFDGLVSGLGFDSSVNTLTDARITSNWRGLVNGLASLGADGKILNSELSALAISDTFVVSSEAEMLALSAAGIGDVAIRTDVDKSYILSAADYTVLANWKELLSPSDAVISVNGERGAVVLTTDQISEGSGNLYFTNTRVDNRITSYWRALANGLASLDSSGKVPTSQIPDITINNTYVVANQAARLALSANIGDVAVQTDVSKTYILKDLPATSDSNWVELLNSSAVISVNGYTGAVTLTTSDISEGSHLYWTNERFDERLVATSTWQGNLQITDNGNLGVGINPSYPLEVVGIASTTDNFYIGKNLYVGQASSADSDIIYFDQGAQSLAWNNTNSRFELSNNLHISGNATTTYLYTSGSASSTLGLFTQGNLHVGGTASFDGLVSGAGFTLGQQNFWNSTSTWTAYDTNWNRNYNATSTKNLNFTFSDNLTVNGNATTSGHLVVGGNAIFQTAGANLIITGGPIYADNRGTAIEFYDDNPDPLSPDPDKTTSSGAIGYTTAPDNTLGGLVFFVNCQSGTCTNAFKILKNGNVGISTINPLATFNVSGTTLLGGNASTTGTLVVNATANSNTWNNATNTLTVVGSGLFTGDVRINGNATTTGRLTVGTTNPTTNDKLWVGGTSYLNGGVTTTDTLYITSYASSTGGLFTQGNLHVGGTASFDGLVSGAGFTSAWNALWNATSSKNLNFTFSDNLTVSKNATTTGHTYLGTTAGLNSVYINNWTDIATLSGADIFTLTNWFATTTWAGGHNLTVNGSATANAGLTVNGTTTMSGNQWNTGSATGALQVQHYDRYISFGTATGWYEIARVDMGTATNWARVVMNVRISAQEVVVLGLSSGEVNATINFQKASGAASVNYSVWGASGNYNIKIRNMGSDVYQIWAYGLGYSDGFVEVSYNPGYYVTVDFSNFGVAGSGGSSDVAQNLAYKFGYNVSVAGNSTTTGYLAVGTAPTGANFANGNLNVQNNAVIGGSATTTGGLIVTGDVPQKGKNLLPESFDWEWGSNGEGIPGDACNNCTATVSTDYSYSGTNSLKIVY